MTKRIKDLIELEGCSKWELARDSGMSFKADMWHNEVCLEFALGMPFDACFRIDLRKSEAILLSKQLLIAANNCRNDLGEAGEPRRLNDE